MRSLFQFPHCHYHYSTMRLGALFLPNPSPQKTTPFSLSFRLFLSSSSSPPPPSFLCRSRHFPSQHRPPSPKKTPFQASAHGMTWHDPYRWMADTDDPDLSDHLARENSYAEAFMADTKNLQRKLFSEMTDRLPAKVSTPPELWGHWFFTLAHFFFSTKFGVFFLCLE